MMKRGPKDTLGSPRRPGEERIARINGALQIFSQGFECSSCLRGTLKSLSRQQDVPKNWAAVNELKFIVTIIPKPFHLL